MGGGAARRRSARGARRVAAWRVLPGWLGLGGGVEAAGAGVEAAVAGVLIDGGHSREPCVDSLLGVYQSALYCAARERREAEER